MTEREGESRQSPELEPRQRQVSLYLVRHSQVNPADPTQLTEYGAQVINETASQLFKEISSRPGVIVKVIASPVQRADTSAHALVQQLLTLSKQHPEARVTVYSDIRSRDELRSAGVLDELHTQGLDLETWLHDDVVGISTAPAEIASRLMEAVRKAKRVAQRLATSGDDIIYVAVTHEVPQAALMKSITGRTLEDLGGPIGYGEALRIDIPSGGSSKSSLTFRSSRVQLP